MPCQRSRLERQSPSNPYCLFAINAGLFTVKKKVIDQLKRLADRLQKGRACLCMRLVARAEKELISSFRVFITVSSSRGL